MRDPDQIDKVLQALRRVWESDPGLRLGQLVVIATRPKQPCPEVFSIEDQALLDGLLRYQQLKAQER